ncbi:hypothetical protein HDV01_001305 [Terramyces sp. JEL0728]|nr:hypothetical protein HDV01_001305 [Terramyces sp. JEL0728]
MPPKPSGIVNNKIPSTVRADGSVRKEIKIRQGFVPQEDVQSFKSKSVSSIKNYIPGTNRTRDEVKVKKEKPQKVEKEPAKHESAPAIPKTAPTKQDLDTEVDKEKRIKQLSKKLRQIQEIEEKQKQGKNLEPEQLQKLETKTLIENELKELQ